MCEERRGLREIDQVHGSPGGLFQILGEPIERRRRGLAVEQDGDIDVTGGASPVTRDRAEHVNQPDIPASVEQLANRLQRVHAGTIRGPAVAANLHCNARAPAPAARARPPHAQGWWQRLPGGR